MLEEAGAETWAIDILGWGFSDLGKLPQCWPIYGDIQFYWYMHIGRSVSHDLLIALRIVNRKKRIMVGFRLFLNQSLRTANLKGELTSELCFTGKNAHLFQFLSAYSV